MNNKLKTFKNQDFVFSTLNNNGVQQYDYGIFNLDTLIFMLKSEGDFPLLSYEIIKNNFLEVSEDYFQNDEIILKHAKDRHEQLFLNVFHLKIGEVYVGEIATDGRADHMRGQIKLTFNNKFLYEYSHTPVLNLLFRKFGLDIKSCRWHIAFDTNKDVMQRFQTFYDNSVERNYCVGGRLLKPCTKIKSSNLNSNGEFLIGSTDSNFMFAIYNKSKEKEKSKKDYQTEFHRNNGLDTSLDIFRIELRGKKVDLLNIGFSWFHLESQEGLRKLFQYFLGNHLSYYYLNENEGYTKSRNEVYPKLDLINLPKVELPETSKQKVTSTESKRRVVSTLKQDIHNHIESGIEFERIISTIVNPLNILDKCPKKSEALFKTKIRHIIKEYPITRKTNPEQVERMNSLEQRIVEALKVEKATRIHYERL